ncbi:MAG: hypothetical protein R3242_08445, partial [Akkermansiaceae bacterium]|nr:hypothetical protein [Akkermansiaceae bacterium]
GPGNPGDMLQIFDPGMGNTLESAPVAGDAEAQNVSRLPVPPQSGRFEVRYVTGQGTVLRTVPFSVTATGG